MQGTPPRRSIPAPVALVAIAAALACAAAPAAPPAFLPSESILPATTRLWVSVKEPAAMRASFNRTPFGQLVADPAMGSFVESFRDQLRNAGRQRLKKLGLTLEDLEKIPSGEIAVACIEPKADVAAVVFLVDATGNEADLATLVNQITERIEKQGGRRLAATPSAPKLVAFELAPDKTDRAAQQEFAAFATTGSALVIGDHVQAVSEAFAALGKGRTDSLASLPAFRPVMERTAVRLPKDRSPVRWYVDPLGYAGLMETLRDRREAAAPTSLSTSNNGSARSGQRTAVLRRNGFDCIKGAGGHIVFDAGIHEILHQSLVYAPPVAGGDPFGPDRFRSSGRMLRFPNVGSIDPPTWVPRDVAGWTSFEWDMKTAFRSAEPVVDDMAGEKGLYEDILASLHEDPDGPQIRVEQDLIDALGTRVVVLSDHVEPIDAEADRLLIAIEAKDPVRLAATIEKSMNSDPDMRPVKHGEHVVWELVEKEATVPKLEIETSAGRVDHEDADHEHRSRRERFREREERLLPHSAVTVAHGHLLIGSHLDFVRKVLDTSGGPEAIASSGDFQSVTAETGRLFPSKVALRSFGRSEKTVRPTYEAIRNGWMPSSKSLLGQMLNGMLSDGRPGSVRRQRIDGKELPDFETVRKYFGTSGLAVEAVEEGWFVGGFAFDRSGSSEAEVARRPVSPPSR